MEFILRIFGDGLRNTVSELLVLNSMICSEHEVIHNLLWYLELVTVVRKNFM
jgi:hypothetical protein